MTRESMRVIRERRREAGLVQKSVWIAEVDREAFETAIEPFRKRAREIEDSGREEFFLPGRFPAERPVTGYVLRFSAEVPPSAVRSRMKKAGWAYDREADVWSVRVTVETRDAYAEWVEDLERGYRAIVQRRT